MGSSSGSDDDPPPSPTAATSQPQPLRLVVLLLPLHVLPAAEPHSSANVKSSSTITGDPYSLLLLLGGI